MAAKAVEMQMKIRENTSELTDFIQDLNRWEEKIKQEDQHLKTSRRLEEKLPPIRTKKVKSATKTHHHNIDEERNNNDNINNDSGNKKAKKQERIKSYDYDAWAKLDVEAACEQINDENEQDDVTDDDEDVDDEQLEKFHDERRQQQAIMEKEKGNQCFKEGKYEAAINRYTTAIGLHPANAILYANRAMALIKVDKYGAAEQDCSIALELDPSYSKAIARRATAREKLKKYAAAKQDFEELLKYEPKNKQALTQIDKITKILQRTSQQKKATAANNDNDDDKMKTLTTTNMSREVASVAKRKRSSKPLKRVYIEEIGDDDDDDGDDGDGDGVDEGVRVNEKTSSVVETDKHSNKPLVNNRIPPIDSSTELTVPKTSFLFETDFKKLKNNEEKLYTYIKLIPVNQYNKLLHLCVDVLISPFLLVLRNCYMRDNLSIHDELESFAHINRFSMAVMFLTKKDNEVLQDLFRYLTCETYPSNVPQKTVQSIRKSYGVKS